MAYYAYKNVRDLLPDHIIKAQGEDYEGTCDYDGDMWIAAADYIIELKAQVEAQQTSMRLALNGMKNHGSAYLGHMTEYEAAIAALEEALK